MVKRYFDKNRYLNYLFILGLLIMIGIIATILMTRTYKGKSKILSDYSRIDNMWSISPDLELSADINHLGQYYKDGDTISLYWEIPQISHDYTLIYRTKDVYSKVYVDGNLLYETEYYESPLYNEAPGIYWNSVLVPKTDSGKVLTISVQYVYDAGSAVFDHVYWGDKSDIILSFFRMQGLAIFISLIMILLGLILIFVYSISHKVSGKKSILYLGIYAFLMGIWSLIETNSLQFFMADGRLLQLIDNMVMIVDSLPLFLFLNEEFELRRYKLYTILCVLDIAYIFICGLMQIIGVYDIHCLLPGSIVATAASFFVLIIISVVKVRQFIVTRSFEIAVLLQLVGLFGLSLIVTINITKYINEDTMDRARSIRAGMLVMLFFFASAALYNTFELIRQGTKFEIVRELAYKDGLTGLYNRASYLEKIESFSQTDPKSLGVIFLDVNNLKAANDNHGHEMGDKLICKAAQIIKASFGKYGDVYRVGGDEFCVLIISSNPGEEFADGKSLFDNEIELTNANGEFPFELGIAVGYAEGLDIMEGDIKKVIKLADANMYENKQAIKES